MKAILRIADGKKIKDYDLEKLKKPFENSGIHFYPEAGEWRFDSISELLKADGQQLKQGGLNINDVYLINKDQKTMMSVLRKRTVNPLLLKERAYLVGRTESNILSLRDRTVSALHCAFYKADYTHIYVKDLNSTNGTFLKQSRLIPGKPVLLKTNDIVRIGSYSISVIEDNDELFLRLNEYDKNAVFHPENIGSDDISGKYFAEIPENVLKTAAAAKVTLSEALKLVIAVKGKAVLNDPETLKAYLSDLVPSDLNGTYLICNLSKQHYFDEIVICQDQNLPFVIDRFTDHISSTYADAVVDMLGETLKSAFGIQSKTPEKTRKKG